VIERLSVRHVTKANATPVVFFEKSILRSNFSFLMYTTLHLCTLFYHHKMGKFFVILEVCNRCPYSQRCALTEVHSNQ